MTDAPDSVPESAPSKSDLARDLTLYTAARIAIVAVLTVAIVGLGGLLGVDVPLLFAAIVAVIIALPLSLVVLKGMRARVATNISVIDEKRRRDKAALRARLSGQPAPRTTDGADNAFDAKDPDS